MIQYEELDEKLKKGIDSFRNFTKRCTPTADSYLKTKHLYRIVLTNFIIQSAELSLVPLNHIDFIYNLAENKCYWISKMKEKLNDSIRTVK